MHIAQVIEHFNSELIEGEKLCFGSISTILQKRQCASLEILLLNASNFKHQAISKENENDANLLLGYECAIGTVLCQLRMWIFLKINDGNAAWDQMIAAQMGCVDAIRAHSGFSHAAQILQRLEKIESLIFPKAKYISAGFIAKRLECSICGHDYSKCNHLRHKPYMGWLCEVIHREIEGDHVAIVDVPADKRCRVQSIKTKAGHQDKITNEITPFDSSEAYSEEGSMELKAILMTSNRYPYLQSNSEIFMKTPQ